MNVTLLYFDACPNWKVTDGHLQTLKREFTELIVEHRPVHSTPEAERIGFRGSPTVLIDGVDPFSTSKDPIGGLSCRVYQTPGGASGSPTIDQLRAALTSTH